MASGIVVDYFGQNVDKSWSISSPKHKIVELGYETETAIPADCQQAEFWPVPF